MLEKPVAPSVSVEPRPLLPFLRHGLDLQWQGKEQGTADCPFCGKESKLYVKVANGLWDCKVCGERGNDVTFMRLLHELGQQVTPEYDRLVSHRRLVSDIGLKAWGIVQNPLTAEWLIPAYGVDGKLTTLYRYLEHKGKWSVWPTPNGSKDVKANSSRHGLFGVKLFDASKPYVLICEGIWDGVALWETIQGTNLEETCNILAVPGANVWLPSWATLLAGKVVWLLYDNDYPKAHPKTKKLSKPVGTQGMQRVVDLLRKEDELPKEVKYLCWGDKGYDPRLPDGHDVRDYLSTGPNGKPATLNQRRDNLARLLERMRPVPSEWVPGTSVDEDGSLELKAKPCTAWRVLINSYYKSLKMDERMNRAVAYMLATIISTELPGDQLWIKLIGPPSCGKTTLCEIMGVAKKYVSVKSTIRGFHSGAIIPGENKDVSLAGKMNGKTLIIKDGDTLLTAPNKQQILGEARDLYDRQARTEYRNGVANNYLDHSMTMILAGTESLRELDTSELGERFVDVVIMEHIDEDKEEEIGLRLIYQQNRQLSILKTEENKSQDTPEMLETKQLTKGYIEYLKKEIQHRVEEVTMSDDAARMCVNLGRFISYLRARPSNKQKEKTQRELCYRLGKQLHKMAKCLAVILNRKDMDSEVMQRVRQVAFDTARGRTLEICQLMYNAGQKGLEIEDMGNRTGNDLEEEKAYVKFLRKLKAVYAFTVRLNPSSALRSRVRYRLTDKFQTLFAQVMGYNAHPVGSNGKAQ